MSTELEIDLGGLLGAPESNPQPANPLETALANVSPEDASAVTLAETQFRFRDLLSQPQQDALKQKAENEVALLMNDYSAIMSIGAPVLEKLGQISSHILETQKGIEIPEADKYVNSLMADVTGYSQRYRNAQVENALTSIKKFFTGTKDTVQMMIRESQPIVDKMKIVEREIAKMELSLSDNIKTSQLLYNDTIKTMNNVVGVLAYLEEVQEVASAQYSVINTKLEEASALEKSGQQIVNVTMDDGTVMPIQELRELHASYAFGLTELEKTWFDWRQQLFLGYAQAPSIRNVILVSATMQRRAQAFRTMGLPSARNSIATWQQAAIAHKAGKMGDTFTSGTNELMKEAFEKTAEAVESVAKSAQAPIVQADTVIAIFDSLVRQGEGLLAADEWGREERRKTQQAMETAEKGIRESSIETRRKLVQNALTDAKTDVTQAPALGTDNLDIEKELGL